MSIIHGSLRAASNSQTFSISGAFSSFLATNDEVHPGTGDQARELKQLVDRLGTLAWERNPVVAPCAIIPHMNTPSVEGVVDYDEFFVFEKETCVFPATATSGKIILRFRRRVTKDRKREMLWHYWEPGYAATKPQAVDELLPLIRALVGSMEC